MTLNAGDLLANKYRIEAEIGRGAFGRVYRARDIALDRVVAIKELHKGEDDLGSTVFSDYVRRFEREARVQARFNHPNIVHVYELLRLADDKIYLAMEYVDGESLRDTLARRGPLPVDEALRMMGDLLAGLAAVHADERDIVHRDLKPSNVMLTRSGQAKLADFGLAQVGDESLRSGAGQPHPGSPLYMSPEQETTNAYLYPASDVFSAGCVLFELLTGVVYKQAKRRKQGLRDLRPDAPDWLAEVVARTLVRDADERPADARELSRLLNKAEGQRPKVENEMNVLVAERARLWQEEKQRQAETKSLAEAKVNAEVAEQVQPAEAERERKELSLELAPDVTLELVRIPAGEFLMGSHRFNDPLSKEGEQPQFRYSLPEYLIGKYPVTVAQFSAFIKMTGYVTTPEEYRNDGCNWQHPHGIKKVTEKKFGTWLSRRLAKVGSYSWTDAESGVQGKTDHPVTMVSWDDAFAFCQWVSKTSRRVVQLPTEAEWEKAARGGDGRLYPWGNMPPSSLRCNFDYNVRDTTPVGHYSPAGDSPYGCAEMAGNVLNWTTGALAKYPYLAENRLGPELRGERVLRGGCFSSRATEVRCASRYIRELDQATENLGFRVVCLDI